MPETARERVISQLVQAATDLFAERGPDGVSLREVAAAAGVNYGLIHQYVGTKEDLLHLVFRRLSLDAGARFADAADVHEAIGRLVKSPPSPRYVRMLAWALLQGRDPADLLGRSPALATLIERIAAEVPAGDHVDERDPRVQVALLVCISLGWNMFGEFIRASAGLDDVPPDAVNAAVRALAERAVLGDATT